MKKSKLKCNGNIKKDDFRRSTTKASLWKSSFLVSMLMLLLTAFNTVDLKAQTEVQVIKDYLQEYATKDHVQNEDVADWVITHQHKSTLSGVTHVYFRQRHQGIEVFNANSSAHILPSGALLKMNVGLVSDLSNKIIGSTSPELSPVEAIAKASKAMGYTATSTFEILESNRDNKYLISSGGVSLEDIPAKLMYAEKNGQYVLAWNISIYELDAQNWWEMRVDASTGQILNKNNWIVSCDWGTSEAKEDFCPEDHSSHSHSIKTESTILEENSLMPMVGSYNVYPMPVESPDHGARALVANPDDPTASPFGWHDTDGNPGAESTLTIGNNVLASEDTDGNNIPGFSPDGTATLDFNFPLDLSMHPNTNQPAMITNLFYWNNILHDVIYQYGFDEASGNFQENNYGNGGFGSDRVNADAQNPGNCNANFGTPPDGSNPRMQMFLCNNSSPPHDGDLDNLVIGHEYAHGISNRLVGGAGNTGCLNNQEQMGEGWSDYYGLWTTMEVGDAGTDSRGVGTYLFGQPPNGPGIRPHPYDTDLATNPHTYDDIITEVAPHGVGSVWCMIIWEMTWEIINTVPFDPDFYNGTGGNNIAMALVTEGMKLMPCQPGFVDGRDAILAADISLYGGAYQCEIWTAFAKRGLGQFADQGSTFSKFDGTEDFTVPAGVCSGGAPCADFYGSSRDGDIFQIDITTGIGTLVGNATGPSNAGMTEIEYDVINGKTYAQDRNGFFTNYEIDLATGSYIGPDVFNSAAYNGLEYVGTDLYGTAITGPGGPSELRILNPVTGTSVLVGATGVGPISGLAYDGDTGTMYGIAGGAGPAMLYTINLVSGLATPVGLTSMQAGSLEFGPDGNLYAGGTGSSSGNLYSINTSTGASTLVGATGFSNVTGLTYLGNVCGPPNDECVDAIPISCGQSVVGSTVGANPDTPPFCGTSNGTGGGVWYTFTGDGQCVRLSTCSGATNYDTKLRVYDGSCVALNCVAGNDDDFTCGSSIFHSTVEFQSVVGLQYYVLVHGFGTSEGDFQLDFTCTPFQPLTISCPPDANLSCGSPIPPAATTEAEFLAQGGTISGGSCETATYTVTSTEMETGDLCSGIVVEREYTVTNNVSGATEMCIQTITVDPPEGPMITCPADFSVACEDEIMLDPNDATVVTDCGLGFAVYIKNPIGTGVPGCNGTVYEYIYKAVDDCGNVGQCSQFVTIINTPATLTAPAGGTVDCYEDISLSEDDATVNNTCADYNLYITAPDVTGPVGCPGTTYTFTYRVVDACGNIIEDPVVFTNANNAPPTIDAPANATADCIGAINPNPNNAVVTTSCDAGYTVEVTGPVQNGASNCPNTTYTYTWTVTDDCGRMASDQQVYTISNDFPTFLDCPGDNWLHLNCEDYGGEGGAIDVIEAWIASVTAYDACGQQLTVTNDFNSNNINTCINNGINEVEFRTTDGCNRTSFCYGTYVIVDTEAPEFTVDPEDHWEVCNFNTQANLNAWVANHGGAEAVDGCSGGNVSWQTSPGNPQINCLGAQGNTSIEVTFIVTDNCGNKTSETATFNALAAPGFTGNDADKMEENNGIILYQNRPNPFKAETLISFKLAEATNATLTIYDINGRLLKVVEGNYSAGYNEVAVSRAELGTAGVMYYRLMTDTDAVTKTMLVID